ncbi:MAG: hypothetical protein JO097_06590, partial [Acidobacteriaceae bacterium]|nr:hypothetical protein [Acidobacteriaceae bacterium]
SSSGSSGCVYALDTSMSRAFYGDATIDMGCGLSVASGANDALHLDGGSLTAANILINSAATYSYPSGSVSPTPTPTSASSLTDPLASMTLPTFSSCTYTNTSITTSRTLNPGTYCGGMTISNGASVTLNSGLYIITGGINWNTSGTTVNGTAVTLFFTQGGGSGYGNVTISGGVNTNLSAPTNVSSLSQGINGVLMATDRSWINTSQEININGGSNADLTGIIYAPGVGVIITGNTTVTGKYFGLVADNISVNGGASLTIPTPNYSSLPHGSPFPGGTVYLSQ